MQSRANRLDHPSDAAGWQAGRRAWSMVRTVAAIESDSIVRRTMRESRAAPPAPAQAAAEQAAPVPDTPQARRFRAKLMAGPHERAVQGAALLLELAEPESFRQAHRVAFPSGPSTPEAELALAEAWEQFRHDRYRALN